MIGDGCGGARRERQSGSATSGAERESGSAHRAGGGESPGVPGAVPKCATVTAPDYLDDDGGGERCFLRYTLAANAGEARKIVENMGFEWDWRGGYEADTVWMVPVEGDSLEEFYDPAPEGTPGSVRYWRFRF